MKTFSKLVTSIWLPHIIWDPWYTCIPAVMIEVKELIFPIKEFKFFKISLLIIACFLLSVPKSYGQSKEVGLSLGVMSYTGDYTRIIKPADFRPGINFFYQSNVNHTFSLRYSLGGGLISISNYNPTDGPPTYPDLTFNVWIIQAAFSLQYYFLNFKKKESRINWSPYFHGGGGLITGLGTFTSVNFGLPFGFGFKYKWSDKITIGAEYGMTKLFSDLLDNLSGPPENQPRYQGQESLADWTYFIGFSCQYVFYDIPCPYDYRFP